MTDRDGGRRRIAVLGAGAMGGLYGGRLGLDPANRVTMIDPDEARIGDVARLGLTIVEGDVRTTAAVEAATSPEGLGPMDLVLVLVKAFDTRAAAESAAKLAGPGTMVLSLQNGLGNLEVLSDVLGPERVVGGVTSFGAAAGPGGTVELRGRGETIVGRPGGGGAPGVGRLAALLDRAGLAARAVDDIELHLWGKLAVNAGINGAAGALDLPNGSLLESGEALRMMEAAVRETVEVAVRLGVGLDFESAWRRTLDVCSKTAGNVCSTLQDIRLGRRTEIAHLNGAVADAADRLSIAAPENRRLADLISALGPGR